MLETCGQAAAEVRWRGHYANRSALATACAVAGGTATNVEKAAACAAVAAQVRPEAPVAMTTQENIRSNCANSLMMKGQFYTDVAWHFDQLPWVGLEGRSSAPRFSHEDILRFARSVIGCLDR